MNNCTTANDLSDLRAKIRSQIQAFPREPRYLTGWQGRLTFAEIRAALTPSINRLMRYYRYVEVDIPDMIAHGFMRLWEALTTQPELLADLDLGGAIKWVMYRSGSSHYRKFFRREMYLEDLATRSGDPDEYLIDGYEGQFYRDRAHYAETVDLRLDIERVMVALSAKYQWSLVHLAALYYITTSVKPDDAAALAGRGGTKKSWWLTSVVKPLRAELCKLLGLFRPRKVTWQDKFGQGEEAPLFGLIRAFEQAGDTPMVETLLSLSACEPCQHLMEKLNLSKSRVFYLRRKAHQALNKAYGCLA